MGTGKKELIQIISKHSSLILCPNWDKSSEQTELQRKILSSTPQASCWCKQKVSRCTVGTNKEINVLMVLGLYRDGESGGKETKRDKAKMAKRS